MDFMICPKLDNLQLAKEKKKKLSSFLLQSKAMVIK
jgi:hypothetical protein